MSAESSRTDFAGRHVLITGASSGIGEAAAHLMHQRGGNVSLIARREDKLNALCAELDKNGAGRAKAYPADVGERDSFLLQLDRACEESGPVDALFLNAGIGGGFHPLGEYPPEQFDRLMQVNAASNYWAIKRLAPMMAQKGKGAILVTGSLASERGMANNIGYVASKHAVLGIVRAAALELAPQGVRVNCLIPGFIDTPMMAEVPDSARAQLAGRIPQGRLGAPAELAETAAFLLSDAASHITGQALAVDGGVLETLQV